MEAVAWELPVGLGERYRKESVLRRSLRFWSWRSACDARPLAINCPSCSDIEREKRTICVDSCQFNTAKTSDSLMINSVSASTSISVPA